MRHSPLLRLVLAVTLLGALPAGARAQDAATRAQILAVVDSALVGISSGDMLAFTDLMTSEATMMPVRTKDGVASYTVRTRAADRATEMRKGITERGWSGEVRVSGSLATVWLPYDLYIDGTWSHCGVDSFTLVKTAAGWRIATMAWSAEQPPLCPRHPDGPPKGAKAP